MHPWKSSLWKLLFAVSLVSVARAEEVTDLGVVLVEVTPAPGTPLHTVTVEIELVPGLAPQTQALLVRLYADGLAVDEYSTDIASQSGLTCCSSTDQCDSGNSNWTPRCDRTCPPDGSGSGSKECLYRHRRTSSEMLLAPGDLIVAVVDPDGLHDESGPEGASNNSLGAAVPHASVHDLSLESLELSALSESGTFGASAGVRLVPGDGHVSVAPIVRYYRNGLAVSEVSIDLGHGISGSCCDHDWNCPDLDGFTVSCQETCFGGTPGGAKQCVYHKTVSVDLGPLEPGDQVSAVIDPDGWFSEQSPSGTTNNSLHVDLPLQPSPYCAAKLDSAGCLPGVSFAGAPSASSPDAFVVAATQVLSGKNSMLFYGLQQAEIPFLGGVLCAQPPLRRTDLQNSGGSLQLGDCSGAFTFDFNAQIQSGMDPYLLPGADVGAQYWYRDPQDPSGYGSGLSNALGFQIGG